MADIITINDLNYRQFLAPKNADGNELRRGYRGMWLSTHARMSAKTFSDIGIQLFPESQWDDIIDQRERDKATLPDLCLEAGLEVLNQQQTNYCWINAPVFCCMVVRLKETGQAVRLSPASAGSRIKNFRNVGGWGSEGLDWLKEYGVNEQSDWPANAIDRRYLTDENIEKAKKNIVLEYFHLANWQEVVSCILQGIPVACGYNWWSHEVTGMHVLKGSHKLRIANSWGDWGDRGYGDLEGSKRFPDDAVAICSMLAA